jgi:hypothetical protein
MTYFNNCNTLNEVKSLYRTLAMINHPDKGGDLATMQAINKEYAFVIAKLAKGENLTNDEVEAEILNAELYKNVVNAIINVPGITIELCGGWLWVTPVVDAEFWTLWPTMKAAGLWFAKVKRKYYFRSVEYATGAHKTRSMDEIRTKYGSQAITGSYSKSKQLA